MDQQAARPERRHFAITLSDSGELVGAIGLVVGREHDRAGIGYWIAVEQWNRADSVA